MTNSNAGTGDRVDAHLRGADASVEVASDNDDGEREGGAEEDDDYELSYEEMIEDAEEFLFSTQAQDDEYYGDEYEIDEADADMQQSSEELGKRGGDKQSVRQCPGKRRRTVTVTQWSPSARADMIAKLGGKEGVT